MASVLTAVLQYHLAWVSTVMPAGAAPSRAYLDKHSSKTVSYLSNDSFINIAHIQDRLSVFIEFLFFYCVSQHLFPLRLLK